MQKNKGKTNSAFTLIEILIVVFILWLLMTISISSMSKAKKDTFYEEASYTFVDFIRELRSLWMSNFIRTGTATQAGIYRVPDYGYWMHLSYLWTWVVNFKLFFKNDENLNYSTWDTLIKEWQSNPWVLYISDIYGSGSSLAYPGWNSTGDLALGSATSGATIIFRNSTGDFPNDGSVFISTTWTNNLKDIKINFNMFFNNQATKHRRIIFDRISKTPNLQSCKFWTWSNLESCWGGRFWVNQF